MAKDRWLSLDDKTKAIWDIIDDKFKNIILGYSIFSFSLFIYTTSQETP
jgi:hypothetical protein